MDAWRQVLRVNRFGLSLACVVLLGAIPSLSSAQRYPARPVKIIVPYAPAGSVDLIARLLAQGLQTPLAQSVVVENRAGAGGAIGTDLVVRSTPDGYTLLVVATGALTINVHLQRLAYDAQKDLAPVSMLAASPLILAVKTDLPVRSVESLIAWGRSHPEGLSFSTNGPGSLSYLSVELLKRMTRVPITVLAYKGGGPAATAIASGEVDAGITDSQAVLPLMRAGRVRALAISDPMRALVLPDLPTIAEAGVPGYAAYSWVGLFAPAGTPAEIVTRLGEATRIAFSQPAIVEQLRNAALDARPGTPGELAAVLRSESEKWRALIAEAAIRSE